MRPSKREKRIEREKLKLKDQQEKSARLRCAPTIAKEVRTASSPTPTREPRQNKNPGSISQMQMRWSLEMADTEGHWGWGEPRLWSDDHWEGVIEPSLSEFAKLTWAEIWSQRTGGKERHKKHHEMNVCVLRDEAAGRWAEIGDYGEVAFRFRLGNKRRLWGYKQVDIFHLIWWDPNHEIYPTDP